MKQLVILLCLVSIVFAHKGGEKEGRGGGKGGWSKCNVTRPENIEANDCCPNKPTALRTLYREACDAQCQSTDNSGSNNSGRGGKGGRKFPDICCMTKCALQNVTINGAIDANLLITALTSQQNVTDIWKNSVTTIVNTCIGNAQADIQKMKDEVSASSSTDRSVFFKKMVLNCTNSDQIVIDYCIKTKLFYDCPTRVKSDSCDALYTYAQNCPLIFFHDRGHGKAGKGGKGKHEGKSGRGGKRREEE
ncbi:hypothetical protein PVAND_003508 [Polypedilum vanderplanki]|uniref:OBP47-like domain-containing protein n=1 Tax=Polypedilum vanderplanki TaxID=319348 RepID=A0A9J6BU96_POLVA|nr:hypothetical protein PVAND_003508 [Polypedilum vanderplanki]